MAPRLPRPVLWLPLVLLAAGLARLGEGATYQQFLTRHVDFPKTGAPNGRIYCNNLMRRRGLTRPVCKPTNTFVHAPPAQLQAVCRGAGRCGARNLCDSNAAFRLTTCRVAPGSRPGRCNYRARIQTRRIRLGCDRQRLPVHFDRIL